MLVSVSASVSTSEVLTTTLTGSSSFFITVGPEEGRGHQIFDCQIGETKNIAEVLSEIHDLQVFQRKLWPPNASWLKHLNFSQIVG